MNNAAVLLSPFSFLFGIYYLVFYFKKTDVHFMPSSQTSIPKK